MNSSMRMIVPGGLAMLALFFSFAVGDGLAAGKAEVTAPPDSALSRDEMLILLKTRQAQLQLDKANTLMERRKLELDDTKALFDENIVTSNEYYKANQAFKESEINYEQAEIRLKQTRLELLKNATRVRVSNAKKYRGPEGQTMMASIELENASDIAKARIVMGKVAASDETTAALLKVDNIMVTLWGRNVQAIIGDPFQRIVPELKLGEKVILEFELLKKDIEHVTVQLEYLDTAKEYDVFLKKESLDDLPTIVSDQFDQQGDLGTTISYNLHLERLANTEQSFSLAVLNWPGEIHFEFEDKKTSAKMTRLKFSAEESIRAVDFRVSIPEKLDPNLIGSNIPFYVVITKDMQSIFDLRKKYGSQLIPPEEIAKLKANKVELILIPKGVGKLDIIVGNLFKEIRQGEDTELKFSVMSSGTLPVYRITPQIDLPLEWEGEVVPRQVSVIQPDQKILFTIQVRPPDDVPVGEYTINVEVEGHSGVEIVDAGEKDFTIKLVATGSLTGILLLVIILVVMVLGIAVASVKIARR